MLTVQCITEHIELFNRVSADVEKEINQSGGIGGLKLKIKSHSWEDLGVTTEPSLEKRCQVLAKYIEKNPADIFLEDEFVRILAVNDQKTILESRALFVGAMDPQNRVRASNAIDLNMELLDNREKLAFVVNNLNVQHILFIQVSYFANRKSFQRYKNALKVLGYSGHISFMSFTEEEEANYNKPNCEYPSETIKGGLDKKLGPRLKKLPKNSLIALNTPISDVIIDYLKQNDLKEKIHIYDASWSDKADVIMAADTIVPMDALREVGAYTQNSASKDEDLSVILQIVHQLNFLFCCQHAVKHRFADSPSVADLLRALPQELNSLDGLQRIYLRSPSVFSFKDNGMTSKHTAIVRNTYIPELGSVYPIHFESQPTASGLVKDTVYSYIDLIKVENIDISEGVWVGLFELEINSMLDDPIKHIRFANRSTTNDLWKVLEIRSTQHDSRHQVKYRITGAFDFDADISNFPFDKQVLEIHTALEQSAPLSVLQPPIKELVDRRFTVKGWKIVEADTGIIRTANYDRIGSDLKTQVIVLETNIVQWTVMRQNIIPALRSLIPLFVLIFLSWYSSFYNVDDAKAAVTLNTTVFLAGVALYFSAEKPKGASFTFIDRLFIYFYLAIGTFIVSEFTILLGEKWYRLAHLIWSVAIPLVLVGVGFSLFRNIVKAR